MREFFNELVLWFFFVMGAFLIFLAMKGFLKVLLPKVPFVPSGMVEAISH